MKRLVSFLYAVILMTVIPFDALANITVYVYSPDNDVYLHAWTADNKNINGDWGQGQKMTTTETINGVTFYKQEMSTSEATCTVILHNYEGGSSYQTADITKVTDGTFLFYYGGTVGNIFPVYKGDCNPSTGIKDVNWSFDGAFTMASDGHFHIKQKASTNKDAINFKYMLGTIWYGPTSNTEVALGTTYTGSTSSGNNNYTIPAAYSTYYEQFDVEVWYDSGDWKMKVTGENPITTGVYIGGCIGGYDPGSWDQTTYAMTFDSTEDAWYYDISSTDFDTWNRHTNKSFGIGVDFRFRETYGETTYYVYGDNNEALALTDTYQALTMNASTAGNNYVGIATVAGATNYRVWFKNDDGTRKAKVEVTAAGSVSFSPASTTYSTTNLSVTLTSSTGRDVYYTLDGTTPTTSSSHVASGGTVTVTGTQTLTAGVINTAGDALEGVSSETYTYSEPSTAYYLIGDINCFGRPYTDVNWNSSIWADYGAINKVLKFTDNGDGTFSLIIPASHPESDASTWDVPANEADNNVSHQFIIAPDDAFTGTEYSGELAGKGGDSAFQGAAAWGFTAFNWDKCLRPQSNDNVLNGSTNLSGNTSTGGDMSWEVKMNGGSYKITIDPTTGAWTAENLPTTHVMYVISKQDGYWRSSPLTDVASSSSSAYNHRHGDNTANGELNEFPNLQGGTVYVAHNWHEQGSNKNFTTNEHLTLFGAWNNNGDLAPVTWINAKSGASAQSIFPTAGNYATNIDPTTGRTDGVDGATNYSGVISTGNDPSTGNITGAKGDAAFADPDALLSPETTTWNEYTLNTTKTLTVTMNSHATGYKYSFGAGSTPSTSGSSTTFGYLYYDGTDVRFTTSSTIDTANDATVATGTTSVTIRLQGTDGTNDGTIHDYTYTFVPKVPVNITFSPTGGLFINSAKISVTGGKAPYTYTVRATTDASSTVRSTGVWGGTDEANEDVADTYRFSTPGYLTVTDADGNSATSNDFFDFTYSTSENYRLAANTTYTSSKIVQTGGGQNSLNVFLNVDDNLPTLWLYAYNHTLDTELRNAGVTNQDSLDEKVCLTARWPGDDMKSAPSITIDGIRYVHLTIPEGNLRTGDQVAIIVSQGDPNDANFASQTFYTQTDPNGTLIDRTSDPAFIYNVKNLASNTPSGDTSGSKGTNKLYAMTEDGSRTIFFTKPYGWNTPYCHAWNNENGDTGFEWQASNEKMTVYDADAQIYTFTVPNNMNRVMFSDPVSGNKTTEGGIEYSGGRIHYTWNGNTLTGTAASGAEATANLAELTAFLNTPPTTSVVTTKHPNGADYWNAAPGDLSLMLDPTWRGATTNYSKETSLGHSWDGSTNLPYHVPNNTTLTQTITGLNAAKSYTFQAIVRGLGENKKTLTLTLDGAQTVTKTFDFRNGSGGSENDADLSRQGSEVTLTGRVEYIEPLTFSSSGYAYTSTSDEYKKLGQGWIKVEGTVNASQAGWLTISLTSEADADGWYDLSNIVLLEDANTDHGFRTTASTTATSTGEGSTNSYDYRARDITRGWKKNNAYSFFDRGKNRNAVIFANKRTVIALDPNELANDAQNADLKAVDRRHPFNVVGSTEDDAVVGVAKALYLTDMGYGGDANNPVDYKIGNTSWATYNSTGYRKSGYTFCPHFAFEAENVILDRTPGVSEQKQTTFMVPFAITQDELKAFYGANVKAWDYGSFNTSTREITFTEVTGNLTSNKPYILTDAEGMLDSRGKDIHTGNWSVAAVVNTTHHTASSNQGFTGTYEYTVIPRTDADNQETHYGYNPTSGVFSVAGANGASLKPFRAYFTLPLPWDDSIVSRSAKEYTILFDEAPKYEETTGIKNMRDTDAATDGFIYSAGGMLVNRDGNFQCLPKGVYIMNGKKYVVR